MKIYISGKITGYEPAEAKDKFKRSEKKLTNKGHKAVIPFKVSQAREGKTWEEYMIEDIAALFGCEAIYLHQDWKESKGARIEYAIAKELGLVIIHE